MGEAVPITDKYFIIPLFNEILAGLGGGSSSKPKLPDFRKYVVPLDEVPAPGDEVKRVELYRDPLAEHEAGNRYAGNWIAAQQPVTMGDNDTGLVVLVQGRL